MKSLSRITAIPFAFLFANLPQAFAVGNSLDASVTTPNGVIPPEKRIGAIVTFFVSFLVVIAVLAALLYIILGAFQWITSGGDKTKVESARNHIIAAVIGLIIIALTFVIINVLMQVLGIGSLTNLQIPTLDSIN